MKKRTTTSQAKLSARKSASKADSTRLVVVKQAAQRPTHASRTLIRRAVRAVAAQRQGAHA